MNKQQKIAAAIAHIDQQAMEMRDWFARATEAEKLAVWDVVGWFPSGDTPLAMVGRLAGLKFQELFVAAKEGGSDA